MVGHAARGFTLVEVLCTCAMVAALAGVALPTWRDQLLKARRADAVAALAALQAAQERQRSQHGRYSADFAALRLADRSMEGLYTLDVELTGADGYRARAVPRPGGGQEDDHACPAIELAVQSGFAQHGPSARCWNR